MFENFCRKKLLKKKAVFMISTDLKSIDFTVKGDHDIIVQMLSESAKKNKDIDSVIRQVFGQLIQAKAEKLQTEVKKKNVPLRKSR